MEVKIQVSVDIEDNEYVLKNLLGCSSSEKLDEALRRISRASIEEYLEMLLGKQLPTRATEIRERRLYHLLRFYFKNRIPDETEVSAMFQLTETQSRTLLRNVLTKFKYDLQGALLETIQEILLSAKLLEKDGDYQVLIRSENILEELRRTVSTIAPELRQIRKKRSSAGTYLIPEDTYDRLLAHYGFKSARDKDPTDREK